MTAPNLSEILFAQLQRLESATTQEQLDQEISRSKSISDISNNLIRISEITLKREIAAQEYGLNLADEGTTARLAKPEQVLKLGKGTANANYNS